MARNDISNPLGVQNVKKGSRAGNDVTGNPATIDTNGLSVGGLRAHLKSVAAGTYTDAVLDNMTKNDMLHAARLNADPANIK